MSNGGLVALAGQEGPDHDADKEREADGPGRMFFEEFPRVVPKFFALIADICRMRVGVK